MVEKRDLACQRLDRLKKYLSYQKPKGAYYIFAKILIPKVKSMDLTLEILKKARVAVVPGFAFGKGGERYLRFSFGGKKEEIKEAFDRLERFFERFY